MASDTITIDKEELFNLIRQAVRAELDEIGYVSEEEQKEIEELYGDSLNSEFKSEDCIRL